MGSEASMTDITTDTGNSLAFACPRCGHLARDEYETLDAMSPTDWRCDHCAKFFNILLLDCPHCASETVSVALIAAEQPSPQYFVCRSCHRPARDHEDVGDGLF